MAGILLAILLNSPPPDVSAPVALTGFAGVIGAVIYTVGKVIEYLNNKQLAQKEKEQGPVAPMPQPAIPPPPPDPMPAPMPMPLPPVQPQPTNPFGQAPTTGTTESLEMRVARLERVELENLLMQQRWTNDDLVRKNADLLVRLEKRDREIDLMRADLLLERSANAELRRENAALKQHRLVGTEDVDTLKPPKPRKV